MVDNKKIIVIFGPTGVGKSEISITLGRKISGEIVNADLGQFYSPCTIGTAKPDWKAGELRHHLFDIVDTPRDINVIEFRAKLMDVVKEVWQRGNTPIVVGGSTFYIMSLFFPPIAKQSLSGDVEGYLSSIKHDDLWQVLCGIDQKRALEIARRDYYRLRRALAIWYSNGIKPSEQRPSYDPIAKSIFWFITRDKDDLSSRIDSRIECMMRLGWIDEVKMLKNMGWAPFLMRKKFLGYDDILRCLDNGAIQLDDLCRVIGKKTKMYSKRQRVFGSMLLKKMKEEGLSYYCATTNLTTIDQDLSVDMVSSQFLDL